MMLTCLLLLAAYLMGSVPTGVLLGRLAGRDPRAAGSGNIGASNVTRTLGEAFGAVTLVVDMGKGAGAVLLARAMGADLDVQCGAGLVAVVGHCYPVWLRFRGGKGVATAFGTLAVLAPGVGVVSALAWVGLVLFTRTPAIGSLVAGGLFVILARLDGRPFEVQLFTVGLLAVLVVRHLGNIRVLLHRYRKQADRRRLRRPPRRRKPR